MATTRQVDPDVGHFRSKIGISALKGDTEAVEHYRRELADARIIAAARAVAAKLPDLPPEKRALVAAIFGRAR